jgi:hypothetical protein
MRDVEASVAQLPADFLAGLIARRRNAPPAPAPAGRPEKISAKIYGVMAATTLLTFAALTTSYQLLFSYHPFA